MLDSPPTPLAARWLTRPRFAGARIEAVAGALPAGRLTTDELAEELGIDPAWILTRTGIRERRRAAPGERLSELAARAGARALETAGVPAARLDLVIVATMTADELTPNAAPLVAHALGADHAGAFDVGAACTAFLTGLAAAAGQIESGRAEHVLLVGADFITRITDYRDRRTAPLFADGSGAVVLGPATPDAAGCIGPVLLDSDGAHGAAITASHTERMLRMDGPEVFRHAVSRMAEATVAAAASAGLSLDEIDLFVPHQANARITRALGERLGLDPDRVVDCIAELGNASAATLPVALAGAQAAGRLHPGAKVMLSTFGAGFTWGAGVVEWAGG